MRGRQLSIALAVGLMTGSLCELASGESAGQPFQVESKVQTVLESTLSRVIPAGKYIVHVDADVAAKTERKLVEGETVVTGPEALDAEDDSERLKQIMPGFLPEFTPTKKKPERASQNRQVYRMIENPVLNLLRVHVTLDDQLPKEISTKAKLLVSSFLTGAYPGRHTLQFAEIPMLPTREELEAAEQKMRDEALKRTLASQPAIPAAPVGGPEKESSSEKKEAWKEYLPWAAAGLFAAMLFFVLLQNQSSKRRSSASDFANPWGAMHPLAAGAGYGGVGSRGLRRRSSRPEVNGSRGIRNDDRGKTEGPPLVTRQNVRSAEAPVDFNGRRRLFLENIFAQSDTYRMYFNSLDEAARGELYSIFKGPAYEKFLDGLVLKKPAEEPPTPQDMDAALAAHEAGFSEFVKAKEWQDRQFFGFIQRLNEEQLMTLVLHEDHFSVCVMLRFMNPHQSALVLDALPKARRIEVLSHVNDVHKTPFHELAKMEMKIRQSIERLPEHFFGSKKDDITYWTKVLDESQDQDGIMNDLENTQPEIYPDLKKTRFKLDEAVNVDPIILKKVLSEADNEELSLALMSCTQDVQGFFLERLSPRRRSMLEEQLATAQSASKDQIVDARHKLSKRFREAMA